MLKELATEISVLLQPKIMAAELMDDPQGDIKVSFGYQCNGNKGTISEVSNGYEIMPRINVRRNSSFSCLSGAALSANATLANTNICNGLIGAEKLPSWDSPNSFRRVPSSPSLSKLDTLSSSLQSSLSNLSCSPPTLSETPDNDSYSLKSMSAPSISDGFLNPMEVQVAGGAAGEDRVQAVCSEENGWLFCAIYDGFNGRDAADFLAGTLYETIVCHFNLSDMESEQDFARTSNGLSFDGSLQYILDDGNLSDAEKLLSKFNSSKDLGADNFSRRGPCTKTEMTSDVLRHRVLDSLQRSLSQAEHDFLYMVEQEMEDRPDLVSIGSCVLVVLLLGNDLYTLNLGDSRAVLATYTKDCKNKVDKLKAVQLTDSHTVDNEVERTRLLCEHPDDPSVIVGGRVKGKLKVTRAMGVGYLKQVSISYCDRGPCIGPTNIICPIIGWDYAFGEN